MIKMNKGSKMIQNNNEKQIIRINKMKSRGLNEKEMINIEKEKNDD